jgi:hypothetical protein
MNQIWTAHIGNKIVTLNGVTSLQEAFAAAKFLGENSLIENSYISQISCDNKVVWNYAN